VDVFEEGGQVVVKAELPGMTKEEVDVQVTGDVVTISGKKEREEKVERSDYFRFERTSGAFSRSIRLPAEVQLDKVTASLEKGVLVVRAPKVEPGQESGRKVTVN
jgi:HSP20 family protein